MNAFSDNLTSKLRTILGTLPGATSVGFHAFEAWGLVLITASSDEAVTALGEKLGLGPTEVRITEERWWSLAMAERDQGALRVEVAGPHHMGAPPSGEAGESSL